MICKESKQLDLCRWYFIIFILSQVCCNPTTTRGSICYPGEEYDERERECRLCPDGFYSNNGIKCLPCTKCHKGQKETHVCLKTSNTRCLCAPGKYENNGICKDCLDCPAGLFQKRGCGHNLNRQCEECPKGYSTNHTNAKRCLPNKHHKTPPTPTNEYHFHSYDYGKLIISLVAIVISLIAVAVICYCVRRRKRQRNRKIVNNNNKLEDADDPTTRLIYPFSEEIPANQMLVKELSYNIIEGVAMKLNPDGKNNWRTLASFLKFSTEQINNIALNPQEATQHVLNAWSCNLNASVYFLWDILKNYMKREDAAELLEPFVKNEQVSTV